MSIEYFAVVGNPIHHSLSPVIHQMFAQETQKSIRYTAECVLVERFAEALQNFQQQKFRGLNITAPFKKEAYLLMDEVSPRAHEAQAVNTIIFSAGQKKGDNTDGLGLVNDLLLNLKFLLKGKKILILGAGGAVQGILGSLLREQPERIVIVNRALGKAQEMLKQFQKRFQVNEGQAVLSHANPSCGLDPVGSAQTPFHQDVDCLGSEDVFSFDVRKKLHPLEAYTWTDFPDEAYDVIINATSAHFAGSGLSWPSHLMNSNVLCYDLTYGKELTSFLQEAKKKNACYTDGLGMLVEQAAEAFYVWHGVRPQPHLSRNRTNFKN